MASFGIEERVWRYTVASELGIKPKSSIKEEGLYDIVSASDRLCDGSSDYCSDESRYVIYSGFSGPFIEAVRFAVGHCDFYAHNRNEKLFFDEDPSSPVNGYIRT